MKCKTCKKEVKNGYCDLCYSMNSIWVNDKINMELEIRRIKRGIVKILEKLNIPENELEDF